MSTTQISERKINTKQDQQFDKNMLQVFNLYNLVRGVYIYFQSVMAETNKVEASLYGFDLSENEKQKITNNVSEYLTNHLAGKKKIHFDIKKYSELCAFTRSWVIKYLEHACQSSNGKLKQWKVWKIQSDISQQPCATTKECMLRVILYLEKVDTTYQSQFLEEIVNLFQGFPKDLNQKSGVSIEMIKRLMDFEFIKSVLLKKGGNFKGKTPDFNTTPLAKLSLELLVENTCSIPQGMSVNSILYISKNLFYSVSLRLQKGGVDSHNRCLADPFSLDPWSDTKKQSLVESDKEEYLEKKGKRYDPEEYFRIFVLGKKQGAKCAYCREHSWISHYVEYKGPPPKGLEEHEGNLVAPCKCECHAKVSTICPSCGEKPDTIHFTRKKKKNDGNRTKGRLCKCSCHTKGLKVRSTPKPAPELNGTYVELPAAATNFEPESEHQKKSQQKKEDNMTFLMSCFQL